MILMNVVVYLFYLLTGCGGFFYTKYITSILKKLIIYIIVK